MEKLLGQSPHQRRHHLLKTALHRAAGDGLLPAPHPHAGGLVLCGMTTRRAGYLWSAGTCHRFLFLKPVLSRKVVKNESADKSAHTKDRLQGVATSGLHWPGMTVNVRA